MVAKSALEVVIDENLAQNSEDLGNLFRKELRSRLNDCSIISLVRGKGLLNAIVINDSEDSTTAWDMCISLKNKGLLAKPTHGNIIRFAPPLVITKEQMLEALDIIEGVIREYENRQ
jgi:ornithine--oxo-acid transaminase